MNPLPRPDPSHALLHVSPRPPTRAAAPAPARRHSRPAGPSSSALQAAAPPPPETVTVWTAQRDLAGGTVLAAGDLVATRFSPDTVPAARCADPDSRGRPHPGRPDDPRRGDHARCAPSPAACCAATPAPRPCRCGSPTRPSSTCCGSATGSASSWPTPTDGRRRARCVEDVPVVAIPAGAGAGLGSGTPGRLVVAADPIEPPPARWPRLPRPRFSSPSGVARFEHRAARTRSGLGEEST